MSQRRRRGAQSQTNAQQLSSDQTFFNQHENIIPAEQTMVSAVSTTALKKENDHEFSTSMISTFSQNDNITIPRVKRGTRRVQNGSQSTSQADEFFATENLVGQDNFEQNVQVPASQPTDNAISLYPPQQGAVPAGPTTEVPHALKTEQVTLYGTTTRPPQQISQHPPHIQRGRVAKHHSGETLPNQSVDSKVELSYSQQVPAQQPVVATLRPEPPGFFSIQNTIDDTAQPQNYPATGAQIQQVFVPGAEQKGAAQTPHHQPSECKNQAIKADPAHAPPEGNILGPIIALFPLSTSTQPAQVITALQTVLKSSHSTQLQLFLEYCLQQLCDDEQEHTAAAMAVLDRNPDQRMCNINECRQEAKRQGNYDLQILLDQALTNQFNDSTGVDDTLECIAAKYQLTEYIDLFTINRRHITCSKLNLNLKVAYALMCNKYTQQLLRYAFLCLSGGDVELIRMILLVYFQDEAILGYNLYQYLYFLVVKQDGTRLENKDFEQKAMNQYQAAQFQLLNFFDNLRDNLAITEVLEYCHLRKVMEGVRYANASSSLFQLLRLQEISFMPHLIPYKIHEYIYNAQRAITQQQYFEYLVSLTQNLKTVVQRIPGHKQFKQIAHLQSVQATSARTLSNLADVQQKVDVMYLSFQYANQEKLQLRSLGVTQGQPPTDYNLFNIYDPTNRNVYAEYGKELLQMCQQFSLSVDSVYDGADEKVNIGVLFLKKDRTRQKDGEQSQSSSIRDDARQVVGRIADLAKMLFWK